MRTGKLFILLTVIALVSSSCTVVITPGDPPPTPVPMSSQACNLVRHAYSDLGQLALVTAKTKTATAAKLITDLRKRVDGALADYAEDTGTTPGSILAACMKCSETDPPDSWTTVVCSDNAECRDVCCPFWAMEQTVNTVDTKLLGESAAATVAATSQSFLNLGASLIPGADTCKAFASE